MKDYFKKVKTISKGVFFVGVGTVFFACSEAPKQAEKLKPNVIYILTDDMGYGDLSCYGQEKFTTPNIDKLAEEGMTFTDHYSGNTVCSPSRAVLITGQHPGHVACRGNFKNKSAAALDTALVTLPEIFKKAGYATGAYGKWGLGFTNAQDAQNPLWHGFDHYTGWKSQTIAHTYYPSTLVRDGKEFPLDSGTYAIDLIMDDAYRFIRDNATKGEPFFCYIPTTIPHAAMHAPKELHEKWRKKYPQFDEVIGRYQAAGENCPDVVNPIAGFAAMMEHLDDQVGYLMGLLDSLGIDDNTVVMFTSDNGTHHEGGHDPDFWNSNGPLRGYKRDMYEGGIRAPFMVRWPNVIQPGSTTDLISAFWDVMPTMADIIGQPIPEQTDGISMLPTLTGEGTQEEHAYLYWEFRQDEQKYVKGLAVRMGEWKAVVNYPRSFDEQTEAEPMELYNIKNDLGEEHNVADEHPELVQQMQQIMQEAHQPL